MALSTDLYDEAVLKKITAYLPTNTSQHVYGPDQVERLFTISADERNDKALVLPLIAISVDDTISALSVVSSPNTRDNWVIRGDDNEAIVLNMIPISLSYQVDVYAKTKAEALEIIRELFFKLVNDPKLIIELPFNNLNLRQRAHIRLHPEIVNTSNIPQRRFVDQFYRYTIRFDITDAYLYDEPKLPVNHIGNIEVETPDSSKSVKNKKNIKTEENKESVDK